MQASDWLLNENGAAVRGAGPGHHPGGGGPAPSRRLLQRYTKSRKWCPYLYGNLKK